MKRKIFVFVILYVFLFSNVISYAATPEEVGLYVASYAKNFCDTHTISYKFGYGLYGKESGNSYISECVSFTRNMYKKAVGYESDSIPVPSGNSGVYNSPANTTAGSRGNSFALVGYDDLSKALPGDIIENYHHDMIYIGKVGTYNDIIANNGVNKNSIGLSNGLISMSKDYRHGNTAFSAHAKMASGADGCHFRIWRITEEAAAKLGDVSGFNSGGELVEGGVNALNSTSIATAQLNMSDWYYNGVPDGKYSVSKTFFSIVVNAFVQLVAFFVGAIPFVVRTVFVGWTAIVEMIVNFTVKAVTGFDDIDSVPVTSTEVDSGDNISIEKIVFNDISIFDVNFFNFNDKEDTAEEK